MSQILCSCGKRVATIHVTEIVNGEKREVHLCEECAKEKQILFPQQQMVDLGDLLSGLIDAAGQEDTEELDATRCPECGMTFAEFRAQGRFGCPNDYEVFREGVDPLLERMHGASSHSGEAPSPPAPDQPAARLQRLRSDLDAAVQEEAYERAAQIRDEIYALKKEMGDATE
ncbi:MAG: UvrB/UvrC motif-containing protein [Planctomycetota bacterium]